MSNLILLLSIIGVVTSAIVLLVLLFLPSKKMQRRHSLAKRVREYAHPEDEEEQAVQDSAYARLKLRSATRTAQILARRGWYDKLGSGLSAAGLTLKAEEFVLLCAACAVIGGGSLFFLSGGIIPAGMLGAFVGVAIPTVFLRLKASRRQAKFLAELPDTLSAIASGLSAGASVPQAIESTALETTGPMGDELNRAIIQSRLGTSFPDALEQTAIRMHCPDLLLIVMAMRLQASHGGNLGELLTTVSSTLRERVQLGRHVRALSAEGRLSLMVLMALPVMVLCFMAVVRPEYFNFFVTTAAGMAMLGGCAVMMLMGYLWARVLVRVEV
jgi:tight adherence protein B